MYVSEEVSKRVYTVSSVILYMTWLTISALCGSYHEVLYSILYRLLIWRGRSAFDKSAWLELGVQNEKKNYRFLCYDEMMRYATVHKPEHVVNSRSFCLHKTES